jgi:outer membrane receptor protein involved in Fe transport
MALAGYAADGLWSYEMGAKTKLMRGLYFNVTGYQIDWQNMQVSGRTAGAGAVFGFISNAGAARIKGFEVELNATPLAGFSLGANLGYVDAKLTEDQTSAVLESVGRKGDLLPGVSKWNLGGQAEYTWQVKENLDGLARFDASYNSATNNTLSRTDRYFRRVGGYSVVNFRAGVQSQDGRWAAYLFVDNLLGSDAITGMNAGATTGGIFSASRVPPRTFGINVVKRFQ